MKYYRLTPWDTKALNLKTAELLYLDELTTEDEFEKVLKEMINTLKSKEVKFVYTRIDSQNNFAKHLLQSNNFYFSECSISLVKKKVQKYVSVKCPKIDFLNFDIKDLLVLKNIAKNSFKYSRFHEDPFIDESSASLRYFLWIDDLIKQNADIKVAKKGNRIIGFSIQTNSTEESKSQLILAGCSLGDEIFVKSLWNEILLYNKSLGFSRIETMISGSNIGVMNVYNYFNFTTQKTLFGFHKFINK